MINLDEQNELFLLIAKNITRDIECIAFGGTAMMYLGYKNTTKDIDLLFLDTNSKNLFVKAIEKIGYSKKNIVASIYSEEKSANEFAPIMYTRGNLERFDIFTKNVFQTQISEKMKKRTLQLRDFNAKHQLRMKILSPEDLVLLKSVTSRERDLEDIRIIIEQTKNFSWSTVINEAKSQNDKWILIDVEEKIKQLQKTFTIPPEIRDLLYDK